MVAAAPRGEGSEEEGNSEVDALNRLTCDVHGGGGVVVRTTWLS